MKKIVVAIFFIAIFSGCNKEKDNGRLDPNSMIALNPGEGVKSDNPEHCTAREIVEWTWELDVDAGTRGFADKQRDYVNNRLLMHGSDIIEVDGSLVYEFFDTYQAILTRQVAEIWGRVYFYPIMRFRLDAEKKNLLVSKRHYDPEELNQEWVYEVIDVIPVPDNVIIGRGNSRNVIGDQGIRYIDTIAYIPNRILRETEKAIKEAYAKGDYAACYELFDKAYTFYPITGAEWRALKEQGIE